MLRTLRRANRPFLVILLLTYGFCTTAQAKPVDPKVLHVLNRLSFGARPGEVERVQQIGVDRYIQEQLSPASIPESPELTNRLASLDILRRTPIDQEREFIRLNQNQQDRTALRALYRNTTQQAMQARVLSAIESPRQLQEVMVDFWFNHFNVDASKGRTRLWIASYEQDAIRPYVLGRFRELLGATARHPAMLFYLDNWQNTTPHSPGAKGRFQGLNENYAREVMELHTLGVDGGYTQQDVIALAKIFTGWGIARPNQSSQDGFYFDAKRHDFSDKGFLGHTIKGSGEAEGEQALDILAKSPKTARHISYQLAQYFVSDTPPAALVDRLAQRFLATDGNIRDVLDTLFHSPEFWNPKTFQAKFKTPYQYLISAFRATGTEVEQIQPIAGALRQLGMPLFNCPTPNGYANTQIAWLNPDGMTRRLSFATALASGRFGRSTNSSELAPTVDSIALANTIAQPFSTPTQQAITTSPPALRSAVILGSPEFMYR